MSIRAVSLDSHAPVAQAPAHATASVAPPGQWWTWGLVTLWWTIAGLMSAAQVQTARAAMGQPAPWIEALRPALISSSLWIPLTMLALWAAARLPVERGRIALPLFVHLACALAVVVFRMAAVMAFNPWARWYVELPALPQLFVTSLNNNLIIYGLLVGVGHALHYAHTARRQQELLSASQMLVLKSQLQPHFLFNTLNTISAFVHTDPDTAERMIDRLGRLLRHSLEAGAAQEVSLGRELAALEPYLEIEQTRFADRLVVQRRIEDDVLDAAVPHFLLQPIVENAVRHGLAPRAVGGTIEIAARRAGADLVVCVRDDGVGLPRGFDTDSWGIGLCNTRDRLRHLHGSDCELTLRPAAPCGAETIVRIPYRTARHP